MGTLVGTFEKYPPLTHWVKVRQIVSEPSKLAINGVNESADAFTTLKSVVEGLSAILDHCDVRSVSPTPHYP